MIRQASETTGDLPRQLQALSRAVELAHGRLDESAVTFGRHVVSKADERLQHGSTHTVAAMLGATGSGKSSLTNALVGSTVATTGVRRPTTSSTLACSWGNDNADGLLDWLEIRNRHHVGNEQGIDGLVLLDVPDHDSVAVEHRLEMERVAEQADLLVWVTDPEKYADAALHAYLRMLSSHGAVMLIVLNKSDLLSRNDLALCRKDLTRLLAEDGIESPVIITASATTGEGVAEIKSALSHAVRSREAMQTRLAADIRAVAGDLLAATGGGASGSNKKWGRKDRDVDDLVTELVASTGIDAVTEAVAAGRRSDAKRHTGWPYTRWVGRLRPHPLRRLHLGQGSSGRSSLPSPTGTQMLRAETAIRGYADAVASELPAPWPDTIRTVARPAPEALRDGLDNAVADAVREHTDGTPRWWRAVGAVQWLFALIALAGALWLLALFGLAWLQIPEPPLPEIGQVPVPTAMFLGGILLGVLLAFITRPLTKVSAQRAAKRVREQAGERVRTVADELVVAPVAAELESRNELLDQLESIVSGRA